MTDHWLEIHFVGLNRIFISGQQGQRDIELELTPEQVKELNEFLYKQKDEEQEFLKRFV